MREPKKSSIKIQQLKMKVRIWEQNKIIWQRINYKIMGEIEIYT